MTVVTIFYITVYPAIVGCNQSQQQSQQQGSTVALSPYISSERSDQQGGGAVESVEADGPAVTESGTRLTDCFTTLVDTLSNNNPQLIEQVHTYYVHNMAMLYIRNVEAVGQFQPFDPSLLQTNFSSQSDEILYTL